MAASAKLRHSLWMIGRALVTARRSGHLTIALRTHVPLEQLQELGVVLMQLAEGVDARQLFKRERRKDLSGLHLHAALVYWSARARRQSLKQAAAAVRRIPEPECRQWSAFTIRDIATKHRRLALMMFESFDGPITRERWAMIGNRARKLPPMKIRVPKKAEIAALRAHLREKSSRARTSVKPSHHFTDDLRAD